MRKAIMVLLGIGALGGFAAGFAHLHRFHGWRGCQDGSSACHGHERFEEHVADICVRAAEKTLRESPATPQAPEPPAP